MGANRVFLDANAWVIVLNKRESLHIEANAKLRELGRAGCILVVTDWVIAETGNGLARSPARKGFREAVQQFLSSPRTHVVHITAELLERALDLYADRPDKTWGLVGCASFVIMKDEGITDAFTTDRHFEQAGFNCLLPASAL